MAALAEIEDAGVLKIAIDDADDADVFAEASDTGSEAADAADIEPDFHAGLRGFIECFDHLPIFEGVHLQHDFRGFALECAFGFAADEADQTLTQTEGGHGDFLEMDEAGAAGDGVKK